MQKGDRVTLAYGRTGKTVKATIESVHAHEDIVTITTDKPVRGKTELTVSSDAVTATGYVSLDTLIEAE